MGKISVNINDSLEEKLRKLIDTKYHGKRAMSIIVEDALEEYFSKKVKEEMLDE